MPRDSEKLEKRLGAFGVYALATGATLSAGFFLLPGLAAETAGPGLVAAYLLAAVPLVPAILAKVELMTAMPRAGGIYYYLDRSLGPVAGTIGGLGIWLVLSLKVAFALVGMGAYVSLFVPELPIVPVAIGLALAAGAVNLVGAKLTGTVQIVLVCGLLALLGAFMAFGIPDIELARFRGAFDAGFDAIFATAGLVYVSYAGLTKIAGIAEEVAEPERNLPRGVLAALVTALAIYGVGTAVIVGVVPMETLRGDLTSVATAGGAIFGPAGVIAMSVAAFIAFAAVTNAGTLSASRYPLAMSRDRILPRGLEELSDRGIPARSVLLTVGLMVLVVVALDPMKIAKLASAFQLLVFSLVCLSVIVMRESEIEEYDPGFLSPLYPWLHIVGVVVPFVFIVEMGWLPILFSGGLVAASLAWYALYAADRTPREGAIYHIFARLGRQRYEGLERELREILKEKGLREADPFAEMVGRGGVIDLEAGATYEEVVRDASERLARTLPASAGEMAATFLEEANIGVTPVSHGVALPHVRLAGLEEPHLLMVRSRSGLRLSGREEPAEPDREGGQVEDRVHAILFLVSPEGDAQQHLRMLAELAERAEREEFLDEWLGAGDEAHLKRALLHDDQSLTLRIEPGRRAGELAGSRLPEAALPSGILVALLRRDGRVFEAEPDTRLREGDSLTLLGDPEALARARERFED